MAQASVAETRQSSWWHRNQQQLTPWLFLAPGILFFLFYVIFPIFQSFNLSLYEWDGLGQAEYVGLYNYEELYWDDAFYTSLKNNVIWLLLYLLAIPAGLFIALFLNQTVTGIRLYKSLFFFPFVISQVVVGLVFTWFYDPTFGILNVLLGAVGLPPLNVLGDENWVTVGIIVAGLVVVGCAAVAIVAVAMGKGPCKKKKKTTMAAKGGPSAPPAPIAAEQAKFAEEA